jgi:hypothetical protein
MKIYEIEVEAKASGRFQSRAVRAKATIFEGEDVDQAIMALGKRVIKKADALLDE